MNPCCFRISSPTLFLQASRKVLLSLNLLRSSFDEYLPKACRLRKEDFSITRMPWSDFSVGSDVPASWLSCRAREGSIRALSPARARVGSLAGSASKPAFADPVGAAKRNLSSTICAKYATSWEPEKAARRAESEAKKAVSGAEMKKAVSGAEMKKAAEMKTAAKMMKTEGDAFDAKLKAWKAKLDADATAFNNLVTAVACVWGAIVAYWIIRLHNKSYRGVNGPSSRASSASVGVQGPNLP